MSGSIPPISAMSPFDQARVRADARDDLGHGRRRERVAGGGDERRVPVERRHDVVGDDLLLDRLAVRRLHPVRQRRDERDERDPDHQRRRRRGRPAGLRTAFPLASRPGSASRAARREPDDPRDRRHEVRREHRDAEEEQEDAGRDREQPIARAELVGEHRAREERAARPTTTTAAIHGREAARTASCGSVAPSRTAAIGGTRVARIAGNSPARSVMPTPTSSETTIVRVAKTRSAVGKLDAEAPEQRLDPLGEQHAERRGRRATRGAR